MVKYRCNHHQSLQLIRSIDRRCFSLLYRTDIMSIYDPISSGGEEEEEGSMAKIPFVFILQSSGNRE